MNCRCGRPLPSRFLTLRAFLLREYWLCWCGAVWDSGWRLRWRRVTGLTEGERFRLMIDP